MGCFAGRGFRFAGSPLFVDSVNVHLNSQTHHFPRKQPRLICKISHVVKHFHQIPSVPRDETRNASPRSASIRDRIAAGASKASSTKTRSPVLRSASTSSKPCLPHRHHVPASERYVGTITSTFAIASERHWRPLYQRWSFAALQHKHGERRATFLTTGS